ncbi:MAG: mechanosensitive ion channel family protein [Thermoanaerobaculaceae bacterium]|nr:mechanosensitive ion channel family protein [Thermoanaerobaculaceae bacterium]
MSATFSLLVGGAAFAVLGFGRLVRSQVLRHLAGAVAFLGVSALAQWLVLTANVGGRWELWSDVAVLLALGYLLAKLALLVVFDWLLAQRMHVVVPRLARDVVALLLYVLVVATVLRYGLNMNVGGLLAGTAVVTVVVGFALQETLGALLAGLALAWEQRLEAGTWVEVDGIVGEVEELGWRSLVLRTRLGERVLIPNSQVARARTHLYGEGEQTVAVPVRLGVAYGASPYAVKEVLQRVAADVPLVLAEPAPQILVREFAESAVAYECRLWTHEPWLAADLTDAFLTRAHAALARAGMEIPFPQRSVHLVAERLVEDPVRMSRDALAGCTLFAGLPEDAVALLAATARWQVFAPGEAVVREGEASRAMYVVARGEAIVLHAGQEVARVRGGEVFGEMAFLSGAPRAATVRAAGGLAVVEVDSRALAALLAERRELAEELANRMASRQQELTAREAMAGAAVTPKGLASFLLERLLRLVGG